MAGAISYHFAWRHIRLKSGKLGKRLEPIVTRVCPVAQCDRCQKFGSPVWVRKWWLRPPQRFDKRRACNEPYEMEPTLCMGCMNRLRPLWNAERRVRENNLLIGRIKREIRRVNA